jgi:hypothetical protein
MNETTKVYGTYVSWINDYMMMKKHTKKKSLDIYSFVGMWSFFFTSS